VLHSGLTLLLAWIGYGVWALAWGFIAGQVFKSVCIIGLAGWLPRRLGEMRAASELMRFGLSVTYTRFAWYTYSNAHTLIIGKTLNSQAVGIYSMAESLANLPTGQITSIVTRVALPFFSKLQNDLERLNNALLRMTTGLALINYPIIIGMACVASELVPVVLGSQWLGVTLPLQILCLLGLLTTIDPLLNLALISTGRVNIAARYTTLCAVTIPSSVYLGSIMGGLNGVAIGIAVAYPLSATYLFWSVRHYLKLSLWSYLQAVRLPLEASAWMAAWVLGIAWILGIAGLQNDALLLAAKIVTGTLAYSGYLIYIRRAGLHDAHEVLCELGVPASKLKRWPFTKLNAHQAQE
jgi:O-antigen/teichoic acid export membrane protein